MLDRAALMSRLMDDEELARNVLAGFLEDMPRRIEALRGHLGTWDAKGAVLEAHTIKGASANVGAERLRRAAADLEKAARAGDLEAFRSRLPDIEREFVRLKEAVEATQQA